MANTSYTYSVLESFFNFFNNAAFGGQLPEVVFIFHRSARARGHFWGETWQGSDSAKADEIALNPDLFAVRTIEQTLSTVAHEMAHQWQHHFGKPSRNGYHNREWADKMKEIGLQPSTTGDEAGAETGPSCTHYIIKGGRFETLVAEFLADGYGLEWRSADWLSAVQGATTTKGKTGSGQRTGRGKTKYQCPCGQKVWGKPGMGILCGECGEAFTEC
jgi:predicted SprT family Zn-dependent metalloprotease